MDNQSVCRVCCVNTGSLSVFDAVDGMQISIKIMLCCSSVRIAEGDGLPTLICDVCKQELDAAYKFLCKCEASDHKLRSQKNSEYKFEFNIKNEIKHESNDVGDITSNSYDNFECSQVCSSDFDHVVESKTDCEIKEGINKKNNEKDTECQCPVCGRFCENNSTLVKHVRIHTDEKPYQCLSCDKKYKDKGSLKRHKDRNHHPQKRSRDFICESCGKAFFSKNDVKIHLRIHTGETPYSCKECPMRFTQISAYLRHQKRHTGIKSYICSVCNKKFCTKEELKMHNNVHTNEKKYSCPICDAPFKYRNNLKKHMQLHSQPNNYVCNQCGRAFNVKGNLKIHIDRIHSPKSGYCTLCSKNVANIEVHMWKHSGERPLKCKLCSSSFYDVKALAHHVSFRHKNKEKHKCTYEGCTMAFPTKPMLDFHKAKLHETGIPFPCDRCSRGFYRKNDLARHKIGTHKERLAI